MAFWLLVSPLRVKTNLFVNFQYMPNWFCYSEHYDLYPIFLSSVTGQEMNVTCGNVYGVGVKISKSTSAAVTWNIAEFQSFYKHFIGKLVVGTKQNCIIYVAFRVALK